MEAISSFTSIGAVAPVYPAIKTAKLCEDLTKESSLHGLWTYPLNAIVSIVAIALLPLTALVGLIAAGIFKLIGCCKEVNEADLVEADGKMISKWDHAANENLFGAIMAMVGLGVLAVKIFSPSTCVPDNQSRSEATPMPAYANRESDWK